MEAVRCHWEWLPAGVPGFHGNESSQLSLTGGYPGISMLPQLGMAVELLPVLPLREYEHLSRFRQGIRQMACILKTCYLDQGCPGTLPGKGPWLTLPVRTHLKAAGSQHPVGLWRLGIFPATCRAFGQMVSTPDNV